MNFLIKISCILLYASIPLNFSKAAIPKLDLFTADQKFDFTYTVNVPKMKTGQKVTLWVPYPAEDQHQEIIKFDVTSKYDWSLTKDAKYGNRMIFSEWVANGEATQLQFKYKILRKPSTGVAKGKQLEQSYLNPNLYKKASLSVPITPQIRAMATNSLTKNMSQPQKIRALYDHVVKIMSYNKEGTGWGKGDPIWACGTKRGNCTDFHSLYIALARTQDIAARFKIGFPIPGHLKSGSIPGYHCWAEVFDTQAGWIPFDASEAKKSGLKDKYFGRIPSDRILFSVGRDLKLSPPQKGPALNYFIYPYMEIDGKTSAKLVKNFSFVSL